MIEEIKIEDKILAIIIRSNYEKEGIAFFTPNEFSQQLGYMKRKKNHYIEPHVHNPVKREVIWTQEVLLVRSGKVRVDFYDDDKSYFESRIITNGDVILLASGGHGFKMLEESEMIEIKQGPYSEDLDKIRFDPVTDNEINIK